MRVPFENSGLLIRNTCGAENCFKLGNFQIIPIRPLRNYLIELKPVAKSDPVVRFETEPGQQMQVDWASFRRGGAPLSAFVASLGWSRHNYVEFVTDERFETLKTCYENALTSFPEPAVAV